MSTKIVICGAHSTGLALIEEIKKRHSDWKIYYFGSKYALERKKVFSFDFKVVSQIKGINFISLSAGRSSPKRTALGPKSFFKSGWGFFQSLFWLAKIRPQVIVSFGGYLSVPVVSAGFMLGIPSLTHEQTMVLGRATKINSFLVKKVAVAFADSVNYFPKGKAIYTGMPLRDCLKNKTRPGSLNFLAQKLKKSQKPLLFVTAGKTGSQKINRALEPILPFLTQKYLVLHQTGELDYPYFERKSEKNYFPVPLLPSLEQGWALNKAMIVISRAGANITFELLALRKAAILIPLKISLADEQKKNALWFVSQGGGELLEEEDLTPKRLLKVVNRVFKKRKDYSAALGKIKVKNGRSDLLQLVEQIKK